MPFIPPETIERARQMDLLTYLQTFEPDELVHIGGNHYCTREHDSLKISNGKWYWFSRGFGGYNALDYLIKVKEIPFMEAVERIAGQTAYLAPTRVDSPKPKREKILLLPKSYRWATNAYNYLRSRGIDGALIDYCIQTGRLYESMPYHNVVFIGLDKYNKPKTFSPHPVYDHYGEKMDKNAACEALGLNPHKNYMLFFGLVRAYKGLDWLLDAFAKVKEEVTDLQLIVAGEFYEDEDKYRAQIETNGLKDRVIVKNEFVADADLKKYFGAADLIVQPYKTATQSGVTQVAFHFEKPCLVTNVGGLGEIIHHGKMGYAVVPKVDTIADALIDYYENNRQAAFTKYLIKEKELYGWNIMTQAFYRILLHIEK